MKRARFEELYTILKIDRCQAYSCAMCKRLSNAKITFARKTDNQQYARHAFMDDDAVFVFDSDHILPKSMGGSNNPANLRITCVKCNSSRGNKITNYELLKVLINKTQHIKQTEKANRQFLNHIKHRLMQKCCCPLLSVEQKLSMVHTNERVNKIRTKNG